MPHDEQELTEWVQDVLREYEEEHESMTDRQRKIMEAAMQIFAEKGFSGASTSEIAKLAGVAEGTIFRHYKTKKDLLYALVMPMIVRFILPFLTRGVRRILMQEDASFEHTLRQIYQERVQFTEANWPRLRILLQEILVNPELKEQLFEHAGKILIRYGLEMVERKILQGELRPLSAERVLRTMISTAFGYIFYKHMIVSDPAALDDDEEIDFMVDVLLNGLAAKKL